MATQQRVLDSAIDRTPVEFRRCDRSGHNIVTPFAGKKNGDELGSGVDNQNMIRELTMDRKSDTINRRGSNSEQFDSFRKNRPRPVSGEQPHRLSKKRLRLVLEVAWAGLFWLRESKT